MSNQSVPLAQRANLSIPEAMLYAKLGRKAVDEHIAAGRWLYFYEGARKRIIRSSIDAYQLSQAEGLRAA